MYCNQCIYFNVKRVAYTIHALHVKQFQMNRSHDMQRDSDKQRRSSGQIKIRHPSQMNKGWIYEEEWESGRVSIRRMYRDAFERSVADMQPWYITRRSGGGKREREKEMKSRPSIECEAKKCTYSSQMSRKMIRTYELCLSFFMYESIRLARKRCARQSDRSSKRWYMKGT